MNVNVGNINLIILDKLKNACLFETTNLDYDYFTMYINEIKQSPILKTEFEVYENLTNNIVIKDDIIGGRYIDNNIKKFNSYTVSELQEAHKLLEKYVVDDITLNEKLMQINNHIGNLIFESVKNSTDVDVNILHESFVNVLEYLKEDKVVNDNSVDFIDENVILIALNKFNEKYSVLEGKEREIFNILTKGGCDEKKSLFESLKSENLGILKSQTEKTYEDKIEKTILKLNEMEFCDTTINDDIIKLYELKAGLMF